MAKSFLLSMMIALGAAALSPAASDNDRYRGYMELAAHENEGVDYRIEAIDRKSAVTVLAIHGGAIEAGSDDAARLVAGSDWNLYAFIATKPANNRVLHLTSTRFDELRAALLVGHSDRCVSMHGFASKETSPAACIGGGNAKLARAVYKALKREAPEIRLEHPCERFGGSDPKNILNRCRRQGVQIEMSPVLRERLRSDKSLAGRFKAAVRGAFAAE